MRGGRRKLVALVSASLAVVAVLSGCSGASSSEKAGQLVMSDVNAKAKTQGFSAEQVGDWAWDGEGRAVLVRTEDPDSKTGYDAYWLTVISGVGLTLRGSVSVPSDDATSYPHRATCFALADVARVAEDCASLQD